MSTKKARKKATPTSRPTKRAAKRKVDLATSPLRPATWDEIEEPVWMHLFDELYESAYAAEVPNVSQLQVPMEQIAEDLMHRFFRDAQKLLKGVLVEAATVAQTRESLQAAARKAARAIKRREEAVS